MAGAQFTTSTETMTAAAEHVRQVKDQIHAQLGTLRNQLAPLETAWTGQSATAFQLLMVRWNEDATRINRALEEIAALVATSGRTYAQADQDASDSVSAIGAALRS